MQIPPQRLDQIANRFAELEARMASGQLEGAAFVQASRDYAELEPVAKAAGLVAAMREEVLALEAMKEDPEFKAMADEELAKIRDELPELVRQLAIALLPRDAADSKPAMLEIRAGTGGDEAALFAGDLYRMYERYAAEQGWKVEPVSMAAADVGGFKEVVANITGAGVFAKLKFESGVHRVQRVPVTESGGRRGPARARRGRHPDRSGRPQDRHLPRERRRRSARQHHRQRDPHHARADGSRRHLSGRAQPAQEPRKGDAGAARAAV